MEVRVANTISMIITLRINRQLVAMVFPILCPIEPQEPPLRV